MYIFNLYINMLRVVIHIYGYNGIHDIIFLCISSMKQKVQ